VVPCLFFILSGDRKMKLDVTKVLKNIAGDNLMESNEKGEAEVVTLRTILVNALMIPEQKDTGTQKAEKYGLAIDIQRNDEVEITSEQAAMLKEVVGKPYGPVVVGPVFAILDGKDEQTKEE
jgi:hypothetical protein